MAFAVESGEGYLSRVIDQMASTMKTLRGARLPSRHLREGKGLNSVATDFRVIVNPGSSRFALVRRAGEVNEHC